MLYNPSQKLCFLHYFWSFKKYNFEIIKEEEIQKNNKYSIHRNRKRVGFKILNEKFKQKYVAYINLI